MKMNYGISLRLIFLVGIMLSGSNDLVLSNEMVLGMQHRLGNQVNDQIFDFTLLDQEDVSQSLSGLIKGKMSIVYGYSGCCYHCQQELKKLMPFFEEIKNKGIVPVGVQWKANSKYCLITSKQLSLTGTVLADTEGKACEKLGVGDFTLFVVDKEGVIRYRGTFDKDKILQVLK